MALACLRASLKRLQAAARAYIVAYQLYIDRYGMEGRYLSQVCAVKKKAVSHVQ